MEGKDKVAIYGGSFDPVHSGHLEIIEYLSQNYDLVIVVPTTVRYYKKNTCMFSFNQRYEDIKKKVEGKYSNVEVWDIERNVDDNWRYIDTLSFIKDHLDPCRYDHFTVMGSDSFNEFMTWDSWPQIMTRSDIVVINRPGHPISDEANALKHIEVDSIHNDMSSTELRNKLGKVIEDEEFEDYLIDIGWV